MLGIVKEISGQKQIIPLTTDAGTGASVGSLLQQYKKKPISGYLYCDGSIFDQNAYPALYMYLGTNVLPDYSNSAENGYIYIKATSGLAENQQDNVLKDVKDYVDGKTFYKKITRDLGTGWNYLIKFEGLKAGTYVITTTVDATINDINAVVDGAFTQIGTAGNKNGTLIIDVANDNTDIQIAVYTNSATTGVTLRTVLMKVA